MNKMMSHFKTILTHKCYVFLNCQKAGLFWQGIKHDMSKFSPTEFFESVKYYTGTDSPINKCKKKTDIQKHGCTIKAEICIIMNIGLIMRIAEVNQLKCHINTH